MIPRGIDRLVGLVVTHSKVTIVVMVLATVVVAAGAASIPPPGEDDLGADSTEQEALDYIGANYGADTEDVAAVQMYVRNEGGNVLSREALLRTLRYQQDVLEERPVAAIAHPETPVVDVSNRVAVRLADEPTADLDGQIAALEAADEERVREAVVATLAEDRQVLDLMPRTYEPGTAVAESRAMVFVFEGEPPDVWAYTGDIFDAQQVLSDRADAEQDEDYVMLSGPVVQELNQQATMDTLVLIGPIALVLILIALTFAYRDVFDVLVGMFGVVLTVTWMFGLLGWLNVPFGNASIIAPVLLIGLSIDYGLHVFMRYREERGPAEAIRPAMRRGLTGVALALGLVTVTTGIGFLANTTSDLSDIRVLAIATAAGVFAAFLVFVTIVPALKVEIDGLLERRFGRNRRRPAIGIATGRVRWFLTLGIAPARRAPLAVIVVALLVTGAGIVAFGGLGTSLAVEPEQPAQWQQDLPGPFGMSEYELLDDIVYVQENFQRAGPGTSPAQILVQGDDESVTSAETLRRMHRAEQRFADSGVGFERADGSLATETPLSVMRVVAGEDSEFNETFHAADTTGNSVPDENVPAVYDALFEADPDAAGQVVERTDGEYRSARMVLSVSQTIEPRDTTDTVRDSAAIVDRSPGVTATATGSDIIAVVMIDILTDNILLTLALALGVIFLLVALVYRFKEHSASLGALTVVPIGMVVTWVFAAMWLFDVPLTLLTALLMSLAIGLGTDYTIHVSERFAQELPEAASPFEALETTVTGTGGALMGSTATTIAAFVTLALSPFPDIRQLGFLVAFALLASFVLAVFVLPSILALWAQYGRAGEHEDGAGPASKAEESESTTASAGDPFD